MNKDNRNLARDIIPQPGDTLPLKLKNYPNNPAEVRSSGFSPLREYTLWVYPEVPEGFNDIGLTLDSWKEFCLNSSEVVRARLTFKSTKKSTFESIRKNINRRFINATIPEIPRINERAFANLAEWDYIYIGVENMYSMRIAHL